MKTSALQLPSVLIGAALAFGLSLCLGGAAVSAPAGVEVAGTYQFFPGMMVEENLLLLDTRDGTMFRAQYNERVDRFEFSRVSESIPAR